MNEKPASTILVDRYEKAAMQEVNKNSYKGLRIHALPGLHDFISKMASEYFKPKSSLLDMAAGQGAMSLRMLDLGFKVMATDYVSKNFKLKSVQFVQRNLNESFSDCFPHSFDCIIASEIIEHLENPRHFARECFKLLNKGGCMILSTPNLENPASKASFLHSGSFLWFSEKDYQGHGHITPLTQWQIHKTFTEAGFNFLWEGSFGEKNTRLTGSPRLAILTKLVSLISTCDPSLDREIFLAIVQKPFL